MDDSPDVAAMLARLVRSEPDLEDVGVLGSAAEIVGEVGRRRADVVVLDLTMPGPSPLGAIRELTARAPGCRVIAFSGNDDPEVRDEVLHAGAVGLVSKHGAPSDIIQAIRSARRWPGSD